MSNVYTSVTTALFWVCFSRTSSSIILSGPSMPRFSLSSESFSEFSFAASSTSASRVFRRSSSESLSSCANRGKHKHQSARSHWSVAPIGGRSRLSTRYIRRRFEGIFGTLCLVLLTKYRHMGRMLEVQSSRYATQKAAVLRKYRGHQTVQKGPIAQTPL
eukprot:1183262-Prorocentrum_minimum.AAC.1